MTSLLQARPPIVSNGVCLLCGEGILESGDHITGTREPCASGSARRPRLLDLFCGAGGATRGYQDAGFYVVGVDNVSQPNYCGDEFFLSDALLLLETKPWLVERFDAIHASPPCQAYSRAGALRTEDRNHPELVAPTRELLRATGLPYVIENVPGAPLLDPVLVCGTFWGLGGSDWDLQRHRLFESNFPLEGTPWCNHQKPAIPVVGHGATKATRERLGRNPSIAEKRDAMGIDWMNRDELSEAIPPTYTRWIGGQLLAHVLLVEWAA